MNVETMYDKADALINAINEHRKIGLPLTDTERNALVAVVLAICCRIGIRSVLHYIEKAHKNGPLSANWRPSRGRETR